MNRLLRVSTLLFAAVAFHAHADCLDDAARYHRVSVQVVRAIAQQESGTRAARAAIVGAAQHTGAYYLDCGNDTDRGQVVIGQVCGKSYALKHPERLPHVGELFPELIDAKLDAKDETPSCSMAEALRKQSLVINQAIAVQAFNMLWTMFRTGAVPFSGVFVNLATGRTNPIPLDAASWARFGYEIPKPPVKKARTSRKAKLAA